MYVEPIGENLQRVVMDGLTPDQVEDVVAAAGLVPEVPAKDFNGDYAPGQDEASKKAEATPTQANPGFKMIKLIFTADQHGRWEEAMSTCKRVWGCRTGSEAALVLLRAAPAKTTDEVEDRLRFWLAMNTGLVHGAETEAVATAAFRAGASVQPVAIQPIEAHPAAH